MTSGNIHFLWRDKSSVKGFHTGVSLHGHTMYSQECLSFLPRYLHQVPGVSQFVRRRQQSSPGHAGVDFARAYWTPPLGPASALNLERKQIAGLGLRPLVSLTDHDDIQAGMALQLTTENADAPISVEWTVPFGRTFLHLGIHNLPPRTARGWLSAMACYTATSKTTGLPDLLRALYGLPEALVILNHPFWLEEGVTESDHRGALDRFLPECIGWIHAFELNATRSRKENAAVIDLARAWKRPLISGGDRHACEPCGCINLTNAGSFAEFAGEIRQGESQILFMPQFREPQALRILEMCWDVLRPHPEQPGRERWIDRVFYRGDDGVARPLAAIWQDTSPWPLNFATGILQALAAAKPHLAFLLQERGEAFL
jgi:hypothetical protein